MVNNQHLMLALQSIVEVLQDVRDQLVRIAETLESSDTIHPVEGEDPDYG